MEVVIANGESLCVEPIDVSGFDHLKIEMPSAWTAANLTLQALAVDGTYKDVYDDAGNEVVITAAANRVIVISTADLKVAPLNWIKLRSGTGAVPVAQGGERTLYVDGRPRK